MHTDSQYVREGHHEVHQQLETQRLAHGLGSSRSRTRTYGSGWKPRAPLTRSIGTG